MAAIAILKESPAIVAFDSDIEAAGTLTVAAVITGGAGLGEEDREGLKADIELERSSDVI